MKSIKLLLELISLKGKRALITGSAAGIGKAIAYRLAEAGAHLQLIDANKKGLESVKKGLSDFGSEIEVFTVDLASKQEIDGLWVELSGKEPDILVNNAGIYPFKKFLEVDEFFLKRVMDVNLNSALWMCQHMIRKRAKKGGIIINVGSIEAIMPFARDLIAYDISKIGVIALTRALAREHSSRGFRINALVPGGIATPGTRQVAKELAKLKVGILQTGIDFYRRLPAGRGGQPDEVARMALVLACDLSSYVHGALVPVDGGFLSA